MFSSCQTYCLLYLLTSSSPLTEIFTKCVFLAPTLGTSAAHLHRWPASIHCFCKFEQWGEHPRLNRWRQRQTDLNIRKKPPGRAGAMRTHRRITCGDRSNEFAALKLSGRWRYDSRLPFTVRLVTRTRSINSTAPFLSATPIRRSPGTTHRKSGCRISNFRWSETCTVNG